MKFWDLFKFCVMEPDFSPEVFRVTPEPDESFETREEYVNRLLADISAKDKQIAELKADAVLFKKTTDFEWEKYHGTLTHKNDKGEIVYEYHCMSRRELDDFLYDRSKNKSNVPSLSACQLNNLKWGKPLKDLKLDQPKDLTRNGNPAPYPSITGKVDDFFGEDLDYLSDAY